MTHSLSPDSFPDFFRALWGYDPFPWQVDFARRLCASEPVDFVTVPTGSGKTACLDAAVFALAVQSAKPVMERTIGRRIFFIVNRRIIVDEAYERANKLKEKLQDALSSQDGILFQVATALQQLVGGEKNAPLTCSELRGGIYRDRTWARSILQPMILCSTVDQTGSRLLFRGYGVSPEARPIHAALVAQDSLLLIDEAHISQPFLQTLDWVKRYREYQSLGMDTVRLPFSLVCMTATPPNSEGASLLGLSKLDLEHPVLARRLNAAKPVRLVPAPKAKGKNTKKELAIVLEAEASAIIASESAPKSIAIMVNRVATAREVETLLRKKHPDAEITLIIGRMRPLDRDQVTGKLQALLKTGHEPTKDDKLQIVVSTQCLEVGADFDFDALVSECASLDALRQRFGRLNRDGRPITARGVIVLPEDQRVEENKLSDDKPIDPIYGNATSRTWRWLESLATNGVVGFGLNVMTAAVQSARDSLEKAEAFAQLLMPRQNAPVLLPAYLDCLAQTNPEPAVEPDVSLFLHGPQRDMAEVQVCWRADLPKNFNDWKDTVSLCPPTSLECLPVPLPLMRDFLKSGLRVDDETGDSPAAIEAEDKAVKKTPDSPVMALCWLDEKSYPATPFTLKKGQTIILRSQDEAWKFLGHVPEREGQSIDLAEQGQALYRRRAYLRLREDIWWPDGDEDSAGGRLKKWAKVPSDSDVQKEDFDLTPKEVKEALAAVADALTPESQIANRLRFLASKKNRCVISRYSDGSGIVITSYALLPAQIDEYAISEDGPDDPLLENSRKQTLQEHAAQVAKLAGEYASALGLSTHQAAIISAAELHDIGKCDPRFQAMLIQGTTSAALAQPCLWAKSDNIPNSVKAREENRVRAELPKGFRHEMLSMQLATLHEPVAQSAFGPLLLHLIASHHGHARPFAPIVTDENPPAIEWEKDNLSLSTETRKAQPAHALDSGIVERFWQLTRHHGWWGLPLLESILRLADQTASANPEISADS